MYQCINLDGIHEGELDEACKTNRIEGIELNDLQREYACKKHYAMTLRKLGSIADALKIESLCERIYNKLPKELQW